MESKPLTVGRLISYLQNYPKDATIIYNGGEYPGDYREITSLDYSHESSLGRSGNSLLLK